MRVDNSANINTRVSAPDTHSTAPDLEQGDMVRAEVLQVKGDQVQLRLESGEIIKATLFGGVPLTKGDVATMLVTQNGEAQLTMQVVGITDKNQTPLTQSAKQLIRMGFEVNKENTQLIDCFRALKLPVKPELLERAIALRVAMPKLDTVQTVFFAANQIDVNEQVLLSMEALLAGERTGEGLNKIARNVDEEIALLQLPDEALGAPGEAAVASLEDILAEAELMADPKTLAAGIKTDAAPQERMHEIISDVVRTLVAANPEAAQALGGEARIEQILARLVSSPQLRDVVAKEGINTIMDKFTSLDMATKVLLNAKLNGLLAPDNAANGAAASLSVPGAREARQALGTVLSKIQDVFIHLDSETESKTLKADVEALPHKLAAMQNEMQQSVSGKHAIMRQASEVIAQSRLHSDITSCTYMQIPLLLRERQQTAELFVLKRSAKTRIDPEHATILVALETEQMGRVETLIKVEGKGVALQFRMTDEQAMAAFRNETADMHRRLHDAGYRLTDMRCALLETPVTPINFAAMAEDAVPASAHRVDIIA